MKHNEYTVASALNFRRDRLLTYHVNPYDTVSFFPKLGMYADLQGNPTHYIEDALYRPWGMPAPSGAITVSASAALAGEIFMIEYALGTL